MSINDGKPPNGWRIYEVLTSDFPEPVRPYRAKYDALYHDIRLRLEGAGERFAFALEVPDEQALREVRTGLAQLFSRRMGKGVVETTSGKHNGRPALYVRRGPNWPREADVAIE